MNLTFDDIIFSIVLVFPIALFYIISKKHWIDIELKKAFWKGIVAGFFAIVLVWLIYFPIELYLGCDIRNFLSSPRKWYVILIVCIGIIGFVEEGIKTLVAHIVCCSSREGGFRPTFVFMSFAGCALSFSFFENIQYYFLYGATIVLPRTLVCSIAHLAFSCFCSYFSSVAFNIKKSPIKIALYLNIGIILSSILHGFFDFILFRFSVSNLSGIIISLLSLLLYITYEVWITVLRLDIPPIGYLAVCSNCRALTVDRIRFCPFCGNRVKKIESFSSLINEEKDSIL